LRAGTISDPHLIPEMRIAVVDPLKRDEGGKMSRLLASSRATVFGVASMIFAALPFGASAAVTSVQTSGSNETPVVSVSIAFEKIQLINNQYNATGAVSGSDSVTWDVLKNAASTP
jgi:hypothetical protein